MSTVWGIDLGVRSFHAAALRPGGSLELVAHLGTVIGKVSDQSSEMRAVELISIYNSMRALIRMGDVVFIEEPPAAGAKNLRTFLKLSQVSAAVAVGASIATAVHFVPVDTWKKDVIGRGGTTKDLVADWLKRADGAAYQQCEGNQNFIDAVAIATYGRSALLRSIDPSGSSMATS